MSFMPMVWDNSNNDLKNADFNFMTESTDAKEKFDASKKERKLS